MSAAARARRSAGLLPYHLDDTGLAVLVAHLGGPFWVRRERAWSIVKGELAADEPPREAAAREWVEETATPVPPGEWLDLGSVRQSGGKVVTAYAVSMPARDPVAIDPAQVSTVTMTWPARSGRTVTFPEVDRLEWCDLDTAAGRLVAAQTAFLDRLADQVAR